MIYRTKSELIKQHAFYRYKAKQANSSKFCNDQIISLEKEYEILYSSKLVDDPNYKEEEY